jgi:sec-independent protein translocase protein TatB
MFGVGPEELMIIALVALLVLGPERMPRLMRDLGKVLGDLRKTSDELREDFMNADKYLEPKPSAPSAPAPAVTAEAAPESASSGPAGETAFDREMREARERLRET